MRRSRCKWVARWLLRLAHRIYPEPLLTINLTTASGTETFIDCRRA